MNYFVYILKSDNFERYYTGQTSNLQNRLKEHNSRKVFSTKPFSPWKIIHSETFTTRTEAIKREHFLKSPPGWNEVLLIKHQYNKTVGVAGSPEGPKDPSRTPLEESRHSDIK